MTAQEIAGLAPAFANYLGRYRDRSLPKRTDAPLDTSCRRLLSELPRTAGEPITLQAGTAVPTLQEFRVRARWDQQRARDLLQRHLAEVVAAGNRRGHRRNPLLEGGRANSRRTTAVPRLPGQD